MINLKMLIENPRELYQTMINEDLEFRRFVKENEKKSVNQIIKEYRLDFLEVGNV